MDAYFDDEPGYRIRADEFALPEISLESDEAAVVALATQGVGARPPGRGHHRTRSASSPPPGVDLDLGALDIAQPRLSADEPSFDVFWEATLSRRAVTFDYRRPGYDEALTRHLEPWGVVRFSGRWYVVGPRHRPRRGAGVPAVPGGRAGRRSSGPAGSFEVPLGTDVREVARRLAPATPAEEAVVLGPAGCGGRAATYRDPDRIRRGRPRRGDPLGPVAPVGGRSGRRAARVRAGPVRRGARGGPGRGRSATASRKGDDVSTATAGARQGPGRPPPAPGAVPARPRPGLS